MDPSSPLLSREGFRMRGAAMSRIDAFSDVVFGFALTLLVVSLEVPKTFSELQESLRGFIPFAICFALLLSLWHSHFVFFRRYGLHDQFTILLNSCLLFVVLFYVYPLKFLFTTLFHQVSHQASESTFTANAQVTELMVVYAMGFAAVHLLLAALYGNAWRQRDALALSGLERLLTVSSVVDALGMVAIGLVACLAALLTALLLPSWSGYSGYLYFLIAPWKTLNGRYFGKKARHLRNLITAPS